MRALARWGITPLLAAPLGAWALGLGDIELQSALNQPFQAEILLVSATSEEVEGLRIGLATRETFEQRGLDRPDFLSSLEFRVAKDRSGRDVVRITSRAAITEPFVTMLIEAAWSRGRSLKEYTVLLDPPVLLPGPEAPTTVQPAQTRPADSNAPGG
ncbi:MAG TPA: fimbrial protein FimV, partial [Gammaproteobacteria bacterium]|nr:fimbrial protein FimV [Gammaproteobacteria bacterium]